MTNLEKYNIVLTTVYKMLERRGQLTPGLCDSYTKALTTAHALDLLEEKLERDVSTFLEFAESTDEYGKED